MEHIGTKEIETERLLLRKFILEDAEDIIKNIMNNWTLEETKESLKIWIEFYHKLDVYDWAIELKENKEMIGFIRATDFPDASGICSINYAISKNYRNKGYATEATYYVLRYLINDVGYNKVEGTHSIDNPASGRVLEKAGMKYERTSKEEYFDPYNDEYIECKIYGIIKEDKKSKNEARLCERSFYSFRQGSCGSWLEFADNALIPLLSSLSRLFARALSSSLP
jgi:ribosomal-protein-alanine N-acetyltransferase